MGKTIAEKIIEAHLLSGEMIPGSEIGLRIDQTLTQDATGTMAYLEFESMGIPRVKTERSVAYVDHNTLQSGFMNADDHRYIQSVAAKHGICLAALRRKRKTGSPKVRYGPGLPVFAWISKTLPRKAIQL